MKVADRGCQMNQHLGVERGEGSLELLPPLAPIAQMNQLEPAISGNEARNDFEVGDHGPKHLHIVDRRLQQKPHRRPRQRRGRRVELHGGIADALEEMDPFRNLLEHVAEDDLVAVGAPVFPSLAETLLALLLGGLEDGLENVAFVRLGNAQTGLELGLQRVAGPLPEIVTGVRSHGRRLGK